jgi:alpha-tubulin suppressor-like RCC1 family protein
MQVGALTNWYDVSGGIRHSLSTKTNGTLWSWGRNGQGQLGLGNATYYSSPKQIGALTSWIQISAGYRFSTATKSS